VYSSDTTTNILSAINFNDLELDKIYTVKYICNKMEIQIPHGSPITINGNYSIDFKIDSKTINIPINVIPINKEILFALTGYQEVDDILKNNPLQATQIVQSTDSEKVMLLNMMQLAKQGKIINCDLAVKTTVIETIISAWGQANTSVYVAAAKGNYATYTNHSIVFGFNKGEQIFEVRSLDTQLKVLSLAKVKEAFAAPIFDSKTSTQEIIGYTAGSEFKIEMVFPFLPVIILTL